MEWVEYRVGKRYPQWMTGNNLIRMEYNGTFFELAYGFPAPTAEEIKEFQTGSIAVTASVIRDCLFFLLKFGESPWQDTPFEPLFYPDEMPFDSYFPADQGISLLNILIDTNTGTIIGMRQIGLTNVLSSFLMEFCEQRKKQRMAFDIIVYEKTIDKIYEEYPSSEAMLTTTNPNLLTMIV